MEARIRELVDAVVDGRSKFLRVVAARKLLAAIADALTQARAEGFQCGVIAMRDAAYDKQYDDLWDVAADLLGEAEVNACCRKSEEFGRLRGLEEARRSAEATLAEAREEGRREGLKAAYEAVLLEYEVTEDLDSLALFCKARIKTIRARTHGTCIHCGVRIDISDTVCSKCEEP